MTEYSCALVSAPGRVHIAIYQSYSELGWVLIVLHSCIAIVS